MTVIGRGRLWPSNERRQSASDDERTRDTLPAPAGVEESYGTECGLEHGEARRVPPTQQEIEAEIAHVASLQRLGLEWFPIFPEWARPQTEDHVVAHPTSDGRECYLYEHSDDVLASGDDVRRAMRMTRDEARAKAAQLGAPWKESRL